jgi:microcystin-dependent protein
MALRYYANAPATALASACTALATSIEVDSVTGFPITYPYTLIIDRGTASEEAVEVTNASGTTLTVTRGIDSTTAFAHSADAEVVHGITARDVREPNAHIEETDGVHGVTGDVVGTTDTQTLTNKDLSNCTATTQATADSDTSIATTAFVKAALLAANPVGSIVLNITNTNPSTYIGGTWVAWGSGRVPVGVDAGQSEFNTVEETGGVKEVTLTAAQSGLPAHTHGVTDPGHTHVQVIGDPITTVAPSAGAGIIGTANNTNTQSSTTGISINNNSAAGASSAHTNLQPYITCYMFKRTA